MTTLNPVSFVPVLSPTSSELTEASDAITIIGMEHTVAAQSGTTDDLSQINIDSTLSTALNGRSFILLLSAKSGHTITVKHTAGGSANAIKTTDGRDYSMTNDVPILLKYNPTTTQFACIGALTVPSGTIVTETGAATLTNKTLTAPIITAPELTEKVTTYASGAISTNYGVALLTGAGATTYTLADPTAGTDDGQILRIMSTTAQAHKVDNSAGSGFNVGGAGADTLVFGGAIGDNATLLAYNGDWYVIDLRNVTIAAS